MDRESREKLYIKKESEYQSLYGHPDDGDWKFVTQWTDEELAGYQKSLDKRLRSAIWQFRVDRWASFLVERLFKYAIITFVALGVIGLLVFGIRQLF